MAFLDVASTNIGRFLAQFPVEMLVQYPGGEIPAYQKGENIAFDPPDPDPTDPVNTSAVTYMHQPLPDSIENSAGDIYRYGFDVFTISSPLKAGIGVAYRIAEAIRQCFLLVTDTGVVYLSPDGVTPYVDNLGISDDETRHQCQVFVHWQTRD